MKTLALAAMLLALIGPATAKDAVPFGDVGYGGSGCSDGTATIVTNDARSSALLHISGYVVGDGTRAVDRKTCAVAIPVDVPPGVAVAIRGIAIVGSVQLPDGVEATLGLEAFVAGDVGQPVEMTLSGPRSGEWQSVTWIAWNDMVWTGCGEDANLRVNTSLRTRGNQDARVSIDNVALFRFATKAC